MLLAFYCPIRCVLSVLKHWAEKIYTTQKNTGIIRPGVDKFTKILGARMATLFSVLLEPTNIRYLCAKFSRLGDLAVGMCAHLN
jgi:hypothetical protein